jgi:ribosome-dependent ATPase
VAAEPAVGAPTREREADRSVAHIRQLSHRYGATRALDGVSLELPAGRMLGLIGPDGVGKSTLLGLVAGARAIQQGELRVLDCNLRVRAERRRASARIAYMPQGLGSQLYPDLSVQENADFFARLFGLRARERSERIAELLAATGLAPFRDRFVRQLSGGMKQKLGLCCSLLHDPELLILDEPTTGVDPLSRRQFWQLIDALRARSAGLSVVVATAYMEEARRFDWVCAMHAGRVLVTGAPAELLRATQTRDLDAAFSALVPARERPLAAANAQPQRARTGEVAIEAASLCKRFGDFRAVDDVSFRIERAEIFGFVGSNGCGKTTTMKLLTGLLEASSGEARVFGRIVDAADLETRRRVGFMSQSFSLYTELTARQNLELHAHLFRVPHAEIAPRVAELARRFGLADWLDRRAEALPLGLRQRLSLAVALIHEPELLILDEPTSGVDPAARDDFWEHLTLLSRERGVTIFLSTHFMNEAARCDRVALMHAGRVLAVDEPGALALRYGARDLDGAFVAAIEAAEGVAPAAAGSAAPPVRTRASASARVRGFELARLLACARRESVELLRDGVRLAFALLGPIALAIVTGYGISFDVEKLAFAALDRDQSAASRAYLDHFAASRYFERRAAAASSEELDRRLRSGELRLAIELPPHFGRELARRDSPEVAIWLDGAMPFRAETSRGYAEGVHARYLNELAREQGSPPAPALARVETRFRYNQDFRSTTAIVPGVVMLILVMIPSIAAAVGVVREKEMGSIANLHATPLTRIEFLLGKQVPYVAVALVNFATLLALAVGLFGVPVKGSLALLCAGAALYVCATTGLGFVASCFVRTQLAAIFATAIITTVPAVLFSGFFQPVAGLSGSARFVSRFFPSSYFMPVSLGTFSKGLGAAELWPACAALGGFAIFYAWLARRLLAEQAE